MIFWREESSLLFSVDPKSNTPIGMKVAHEDSSIRRSLHSSIFILTAHIQENTEQTPKSILSCATRFCFRNLMEGA